MSTVTLQTSVTCKAPLHALWSALSDTDRINRAIGNKPVAMTAKNDGTSTRFLARTTLGGFNVTYDERPYEWVYLKRFQVLRKMHNGPVSALAAIYEFEHGTDASTVILRLVLTPRSVWLAPVVRLSAARGLDKLAAEVRRIDAALVRGEALPRVPAQPRVDKKALARAEEALRWKIDRALVDQLVALVRDGSDLDVARVRPFVLADAWKQDRSTILKLCLYAAKVGLLELRWNIICPSCRAPSDTVPSLADLKAHGLCQICELGFEIELDDAVEATFAPAPGVRPCDEQKYCIGGPARTPHVLAQTMLPAHGEALLECLGEPGRYRLFIRGGAQCSILLAEGAPVTATVDATAVPKVVTLAPGGTLTVKNPAKGGMHCKVERVEHAALAASARIVTALPEFRRDFSADLLKPGSTFKLSRLALLFSDLAASTQLYADAGDAPAYKIVQDHFDVVIKAIEQNGGALVKTIGDAVMAVFTSDMDGMRAAVAILDAFERFRSERPERQKTDIKVGLYGGPCFAITANGVLDYFGQTVNIAARMQGEAHSGELVIAESVANDAVATGVIEAGQVRERYMAALKGVGMPIAAARVKR